jgi:hypothetical protein
MRLALFLALLIGSGAQAENESRSTEYVTRTSFFAAPTVESDGHSTGVGVTLGLDQHHESSAPRLTYSDWGPLIKALAIDHGPGIQGGLALYGFNFGVRSWEFLPMAYEVAVGTAFGSGRNLGILEAGIFIGTTSTLQVGIISYTPLATADKPNWFPDWSLSIRFPFSLGVVRKERVVESHTAL